MRQVFHTETVERRSEGLVTTVGETDSMSDYVELTAADLADRWRQKTVLELLDIALRRQVREEYGSPEAALRWHLILAWSELQQARRSALDGRWSIACESRLEAIVGLTGLVGPLPWEEVPLNLILDGLYERIHEAAGTPTPLTDEDWVRARVVPTRWATGVAASRP